MAARLLACCPGLPMVVCVDETEPRLEEYRALGVDLLVMPGEGAAGPKLAYAAEQREAEVYVPLSDRCVPQGDWYETMTTAGPVALCDCRFDGAPVGFSGIFAVKRRCIDATGWLVPPGIEHYGIDNFWNWAAREAGVAVETDVRIDIPDYSYADPVRKRTLARRREYEAQWKRFRKSPAYAEAVERLRCVS